MIIGDLRLLKKLHLRPKLAKIGDMIFFVVVILKYPRYSRAPSWLKIRRDQEISQLPKFDDGENRFRKKKQMYV